MKRQATDWKKVFANHLSDRVPKSRIYEELSKHSNKKTVIKWAISTLFIKEDIQMASNP